MMEKLPKEQLEKGVICSSAGNHAQGVALAAKRLNCSAVIAMPVTTPEIKVHCFLLVSAFLIVIAMLPCTNTWLLQMFQYLFS